MLGSIERVVRALNEADVKYLVVGGVAVVLHGHLRTTADLDLVVQLEPDNARRAMAALSAIGYRPRAPVQAAEFAEPAKRREWIEEKGLTVFSLWTPNDPLEVDLFVSEPFDFPTVHARATVVPLETTAVTVIGLDDLLSLKRSAGRPRDLEDIEVLSPDSERRDE